jgi:hypothetical protein
VSVSLILPGPVLRLPPSQHANSRPHGKQVHVPLSTIKYGANASETHRSLSQSPVVLLPHEMTVSASVGTLVGTSVGASVGVSVGTSVCSGVGAPDICVGVYVVGVPDGVSVGTNVGPSPGLTEVGPSLGVLVCPSVV